MQYGDEKKEKLNRLERKLYSRNTPTNIIDEGRSELKSNVGNDDANMDEETIGENWQNAKAGSFDELAAKVSKMAQRKHNFINKIFIFSALFFVIACAVAAYVFFGGINSVSSKNVDIQVVGPLSIPGGQEVSFDINVINNNNTNLDSASLLVEYPTSTRSAADLTQELNQERFALGSIKSGESFDQNIKAVFFGEKDDVKQLKISLEYRVANSSALFYKDKTYEMSISSDPVIITPTYPKEVNSNQQVSFNIEAASNSKDVVNNFLINVEYPFGFVFKDASPKPSFNNNIWQFSSLNPGEKKTISITGNIIGQDNEEKVFKINAGTAGPNDERVIAVPFSQLVESITVKKPFIGLDVSVGGQSGDFVTQGNNEVSTQFTVANNLPSGLFNLSVQVALSGGALNQNSVFPDGGGFFQSSDNTILWDKRSVSEFSNMDSGSEKSLSFRLSPLLYANIAKGASPEVDMTITAQGDMISDSGSSETVSSVETRKIILATDTSLSSKIARFSAT